MIDGPHFPHREARAVPAWTGLLSDPFMIL